MTENEEDVLMDGPFYLSEEQEVEFMKLVNSKLKSIYNIGPFSDMEDMFEDSDAQDKIEDVYSTILGVYADFLTNNGFKF